MKSGKIFVTVVALSNSSCAPLVDETEAKKDMTPPVIELSLSPDAEYFNATRINDGSEVVNPIASSNARNMEAAPFHVELSLRNLLLSLIISASDSPSTITDGGMSSHGGGIKDLKTRVDVEKVTCIDSGGMEFVESSQIELSRSEQSRSISDAGAVETWLLDSLRIDISKVWRDICHEKFSNTGPMEGVNFSGFGSMKDIILKYRIESNNHGPAATPHSSLNGCVEVRNIISFDCEDTDCQVTELSPWQPPTGTPSGCVDVTYLDSV